MLNQQPDQGRRREDATKDRRVEVRPEDSGNGWIAARELPPAAALAIDRKLTARARQFKKAGVGGTMDELRALAFLERFGEAEPLGDLRDENGDGNGGRGPQPGDAPDSDCGAGPQASGRGCAGGTVTHINLTAPAADMTGQASRPGEMDGVGPLDPWTIRDLTSNAARDAWSAWCFTITDKTAARWKVVSMPSTFTFVLLAPPPGVSHLAPLPTCTTPGTVSGRISEISPLSPEFLATLR